MEDDRRELRLEGASGLRLAASAWGDPSAPPVLLLHGAGQSRQAWRRTGRMLAEAGRYAVAVDHRGHGDSDWPVEADYEFDHVAADVERLVAQLAAPPVLVGASLGGIAGLVAQGRSAEQLYEALVLVDVTPAMDYDGIRRIVTFMAAHPDGFATLEEASLTIAEFTGRPRPAGVDGLRNVLRPDLGTGRWRWHWDARFLQHKSHLVAGRAAPDPGLAAHAERVRTQLEAAAAKVRVPTLIVRGSKSDLVTPDAVRSLQRIIPGAAFVDVADAGHMVAGDDNDAFTTAVIDFLAEAARSEGGSPTASVGGG